MFLAMKTFHRRLLLPLLALWFTAQFASAKHTVITRRYKFNIQLKNVTRLCTTKALLTVNGQYPGPAIVAREGDRVVVNVTNNVQNNVSIHWHGIRQLRSGWADGPAYVTQCPIQTGQSYVYKFIIKRQRGTLWWHAHISWLRASIHGAIILYPKKNASYPFPRPDQEVPIVFGEWWNADTETVINQAMQSGAQANVSDAYTMNGLPGLMYNCSANGEGGQLKWMKHKWTSHLFKCKSNKCFLSSADTFRLKVIPGKTYLLRLVNAALNDDLFFGIANHTLTVVEADAVYVKPFQSNVILITPGQTTNVLLTAMSQPPNATFLMFAGPFATGSAAFDNSTSAGVLEYVSNGTPANSSSLPMMKPTLPAPNDTSFAANFSQKLRSLGNPKFPSAAVPLKVDKQFLFTVGLGLNPCPQGQTCQGPNNTKFAASINNISFIQPTTALLQAYYFNQSNGVYNTTFPDNPPFPFNYTGTPPNNTGTLNDTRVEVLSFNTSVQLVLQDTSIVTFESHPLHLHGFNFFIVGQGTGNYNASTDPANFNLVDPPERNTVGVPSGGWAALRFLADNPGVWFMHCHLELHTSWGLKMAWVVLNGNGGRSQTLLPPPKDLPAC